MILSGNDNHVAGMGSMFPVKGTTREGKIGYEGHLTDRIVTVAQLLKDGGTRLLCLANGTSEMKMAIYPTPKDLKKVLR
jgi:hypothetical protein